MTFNPVSFALSSITCVNLNANVVLVRGLYSSCCIRMPWWFRRFSELESRNLNLFMVINRFLSSACSPCCSERGYGRFAFISLQLIDVLCSFTLVKLVGPSSSAWS